MPEVPADTAEKVDWSVLFSFFVAVAFLIFALTQFFTTMPIER